MKRELIWVAAIIAFSILLVAGSTSFMFTSLEVQLHDTYFIVRSIHVIASLSIVFIVARYGFQLIIYLSIRYKLFAIGVLLIIPVMLYFIIAYVYLMASLVIVIAEESGALVPGPNSLIVYVPALLFVIFLTFLEIIAIRIIAGKKQ